MKKIIIFIVLFFLTFEMISYVKSEYHLYKIKQMDMQIKSILKNHYK